MRYEIVVKDLIEPTKNFSVIEISGAVRLCDNGTRSYYYRSYKMALKKMDILVRKYPCYEFSILEVDFS